MLRRFLLTSVAPVLTMAAFGGVAFAQQAPAPAAPTNTLGEIVVTAQHRSENLQHAAVVVDAVTGANLVKNGITDATQLSSQVPGLSAPAFGGGTVSYFIRGVGNFSEEPFGDPAIAFNYDGVYVGLPVEAAMPFYDLQRVEVLKGPQGTLYGRNATGGAINVIPQTPQLNKYGGYITASAGNYSAYNVESAVNLPVGENTAIRIASDFISHSAYLSDGTSDEDTKSVRAQIYSRLTNDLKVRVAADYTDVSGVGTGAYYSGYYSCVNPAAHCTSYTFHPSGLSADGGVFSPGGQAFLPSIFGGGAPAGRPLQADTSRPFTNNKLYGVNAEINYDIGPGSLTLIPAARWGSIGFGYGTIGTPAVTVEDVNQQSVELRYTGHRIGLFDYTFGGMYFHQSQSGIFNIDQGPVDVFQNYDTTVDSYAGFARLTTNFTDKFRLVTGARYTVDDKHFAGVSEALTIVCTINPAVGCPTAPNFAVSRTPSGQSLPVPATAPGVAVIGPGLIISRGDTTIAPSSLSKSAPTFRVALEYDLAPHSLLYASVETGYRSGGFNMGSSSATTNDTTYKPEYITAYTLGSKNRFFGNRVELNAELFIWKYRDQQISHLTEDALGAPNNLVQNVGAATNQGVEIEGRYAITPLTVVNANVQYLDAHYDKFSYVSLANASDLSPTTGCAVSPPASAAYTGAYTVDCSGKQAINSPKYTLNFGVEQTIPLDAYKLVASANTQYLSSRYVAFDYLPQELAPAVWQSNAQLTLSPEAEKWSITAYVQNIEGTRYPVNIARLPTGNFLVNTTAPPRVFGARLNVKF